MKNKKSLEKSMKSCIRRAQKHSGMLHTHMEELNKKFDGHRMSIARGLAERIIKDVHEASAYSNSLYTE